MGDKGNIGVHNYSNHAINTSNTLGRPSVAAHSPSFLLDASNCSMTQAQATEGKSYLQLPPTSASEGLCKQNKDRLSPEPLPGIWMLRCELPFGKKYYFSPLIILLVQALYQVWITIKILLHLITIL